MITGGHAVNPNTSDDATMIENFMSANFSPAELGRDPQLNPVEPEVDPKPVPSLTNKINNWVNKHLVLVIVGVGTAVLVTLVTAAAYSSQDTQEGSARPAIPVCEVEDGSTQDVCLFHGDKGWILNLNHGKSSYVPHSGHVVNYSH
jgi:hypothetical protein